MMPVEFNALAQQCAPSVRPTTLQAVVRTESGFNPYAIGVVGGRLARQPRDRAEAVATAKALDSQGINFSMGLGQVNKANLARYGLTYDTAFDLCANLRAGADNLHGCYTRAAATMGPGDEALRAAISCYYSGNFTHGFKSDYGGSSYVQRVLANASPADTPVDVVPAIPVVMDPPRAGGPVHIKPVVAHGAGASHGAVAPDTRNQTHPSWDAFGDSACDNDCN
jgi:type IV secretion system protein VirB1